MSTAPGRLNWPFAAAWAALTCIGWLLAVGLATADAGVSYYLLAAVFAQLVTMALRWRLITGRPRARLGGLELPVSTDWFATAAAADHELTWVLCWVSELHVLGIVLLGPGWGPALGLGLTIIISEILLLRFAPAEWNERLPQWWPREMRPRSEDRPLASTFDWPQSESESDLKRRTLNRSLSPSLNQRRSAPLFMA